MYYTLLFLSIVASVASALMILAFLILGLQVITEHKSRKPFPRDAKGRFLKRK